MICRISIGWSFCLRLCWSKASHAADRLRRSTVGIKKYTTIKMEEKQRLYYPHPNKQIEHCTWLMCLARNVKCPLKVTSKTGFRTPTDVLLFSCGLRDQCVSFLAVKYLLCSWVLWRYYTNYCASKNYVFHALCSYR